MARDDAHACTNIKAMRLLKEECAVCMLVTFLCAGVHELCMSHDMHVCVTTEYALPWLRR